MIVEIFTDGACDPNPGRGGWAALLRYGYIEKEISGCEPNTTNNRMELMGAISALESLKRPCEVQLYTDSQYVQKGITEWISGWKRQNWVKKGQPIKNKDLWLRLDALNKIHKIEWIWIKGHDGHPENVRVDLLAGQARRRLN